MSADELTLPIAYASLGLLSCAAGFRSSNGQLLQVAAELLVSDLSASTYYVTISLRVASQNDAHNRYINYLATCLTS